MKLIADGNSGADMQSQVRAAYRAHERTKYNLLVGRTYTPLAMALFSAMGLKVLILDESKRPNWIPLALFSVADGRLPVSWTFGTPRLANAPTVAAVWGYQELLANPAHFEQLIEREIRAWEAFVSAASDRDDLEAHERSAVEFNREKNRRYREHRD